MLECQYHTCRSDLNKVLERETMDDCDKIMVKIKEDRHHKTFERQKAKLDQLMRKEEPANKDGCSNQNMQRYMYHSCNRYMYQSGTNNTSKTSSTTPDTGTTSEDPNNSRSTPTTTTAAKSNSQWVINMSKKPLTDPQVKLLAHGPNYAVTPRNPPIEEYIAAVEKTCQNLTQGELMRCEQK